jgi:hypothetical protein
MAVSGAAASSHSEDSLGSGGLSVRKAWNLQRLGLIASHLPCQVLSYRDINQPNQVKRAAGAEVLPEVILSGRY